MNEYARKRIEDLAEENYKEFSAALVPNVKNMLGVRLPLLRALAKELAKGDWEEALDGADLYFEEVMLRGMVIGAIKIDTPKRFEYIRKFVPLIDNWSVCDSFCVGLKFAKKSQAEVWEFLQPYIGSKNEFFARFGAVMLLDHFINDEYIKAVLEALGRVSCEAYYAKMSVGWALATCMSKYPDMTYGYICNNDAIDRETLKLTVKKSCESYKVDDEYKKKLRALIKYGRN